MIWNQMFRGRNWNRGLSGVDKYEQFPIFFNSGSWIVAMCLPKASRLSVTPRANASKANQGLVRPIPFVCDDVNVYSRLL